MAATIRIMRLTGANTLVGGATPLYTNITTASTRMSTSDAAVPGTANPIPVPTSGCNHSMWVTTQLYSACAPDNSITNIKWYTDGTNSFGTGTECLVATASSYVVATGGAGSSGSLLNTTNHAGLIGAASNAFTYTSNSASKLSVAASIAAATGSFGDRVIFQLNVGTTGVAGTSGEETFTFAFDEA